MANPQSYQLNGKQMGASKQQLSQERSPQLNLKGSMQVGNNQFKKPGKQFVYSSAPHSPKVPVPSQHQVPRELSKGGVNQFTTTRTNTNVLSSSHNNIIQKNANQ
jgi:hypothetical protein